MTLIWTGWPKGCVNLRHKALAALEFGDTVNPRADEVQAGAYGEPKS